MGGEGEERGWARAVSRLWPIQFWPIHFWPLFGQPIWPIHFWPKFVVCGLWFANFGQSNFGQSIFGQSFFLCVVVVGFAVGKCFVLFVLLVCCVCVVCVCGGCVQGLSAGPPPPDPPPPDPPPPDPPPPDRPKFRAFFPSPATVFILFSLSFGLFRGILVVFFEAPGRSNVHVWSSRVVVCEPRRPSLANLALDRHIVPLLCRAFPLTLIKKHPEPKKNHNTPNQKKTKSTPRTTRKKNRTNKKIPEPKTKKKTPRTNKKNTTLRNPQKHNTSKHPKTQHPVHS